VQVHKLVHLHGDSPRDSQYRDSRLTGLFWIHSNLQNH
jgi:hypothetical protein